MYARRSGWGERIASRGVAQDVLFLIDGVPLITKNSVFELDEVGISLENIKRIEVMRGPGSVIWGANAFLGLVNIITKSPEDIISEGKDYGMEFSATIGSWRTKEYSAAFAKKFKNGFSIYGHLAGLTSLDYPMEVCGPGMSSPLSTKDKRNQDSMHNLNIKINYKDLIKFSIFLNDLKDYMQVDSRKDVVIDNNYNGEDNNPYNLYRLEFSKNFLENKLNVKLLLTELDRITHNHWIYFTPDYLDYELWQGNKNDWEKSKQIDLQFDYSGIERNRFILGLNYFKQSQPIIWYLDNTMTNDPRGDTRYWYLLQENNLYPYDQGPNDAYIQSIFLQDDIELHKRLKLQLGIRYDKHEMTENVRNPKGSLVWAFNDNGVLKLLYGRGFREPEFNYWFSTHGVIGTATYPNGPPGHEGDPEYMPAPMKPEKSEAQELQLAYNFKNIDLKTNFNYAFSKCKDLATWRWPYEGTAQEDNDWQFPFNSGKREIKTYEFEAFKNFTKPVGFIKPGSYLMLNLTRNIVKEFSEKTNAWETDSHPEITYNFMGFIRTSPKFSFNFRLFGMKYTKDNASDPKFRKVNDYKYGAESFNKLDLGFNYVLNYDEKGGKITDLSLNIYNVFNKEYYQGGYFNIGDPQPRRSIFLTLNQKF
ncbi:MAG TPA: TonB-dependent receptor [bacterium]|nr:TonB-dependent receptor [bacterium]